MWNEFLENIANEVKGFFIDKETLINNYVNWLNDEIVKNTSFYPLKNWWTNTTTHHLEQDEKWNIIFKPKTLMFWIIKIILLIPIFVILYIIITKDLSWEITYIKSIKDYKEAISISIILNIFLWLVISVFSKTKIFDFENNCFYDLRFKKLVWNKDIDLTKIWIIDFSKIYAIQIIPEKIKNNNNTENQVSFDTYYTSYELNLILKDSSRVLVVDHWNLSEIRNNAQVISQKLNIKIYDLTTVLNG